MIVQSLRRSIETADPVQSVTQAEGLKTVHESGVDAVLWDRTVPPTMLASLAAIPRAAIQECRVSLPIEQIGERLPEIIVEAGGIAPSTRQWLIDDISLLARSFAGALPTSRIHLRTEWVTNDACKRFHRDAVRARMICTYRGPGTEFGVARDGEEPATIQAAPTGWAIMLKGKLWPNPASNTLLHRSPRIGSLGISRLVVVIDEADHWLRQ